MAEYMFSTAQNDDIEWFIDIITEKVYDAYADFISDDIIMPKELQNNKEDFLAALVTIGNKIKKRVDEAVAETIDTYMIEKGY